MVHEHCEPSSSLLLVCQLVHQKTTHHKLAYTRLQKKVCFMSYHVIGSNIDHSRHLTTLWFDSWAKPLSAVAQDQNAMPEARMILRNNSRWNGVKMCACANKFKHGCIFIKCQKYIVKNDNTRICARVLTYSNVFEQIDVGAMLIFDLRPRG